MVLPMFRQNVLAWHCRQCPLVAWYREATSLGLDTKASGRWARVKGRPFLIFITSRNNSTAAPCCTKVLAQIWAAKPLPGWHFGGGHIIGWNGSNIVHGFVSHQDPPRINQQRWPDRPSSIFLQQGQGSRPPLIGYAPLHDCAEPMALPDRQLTMLHRWCCIFHRSSSVCDQLSCSQL